MVGAAGEAQIVLSPPVRAFPSVSIHAYGVNALLLRLWAYFHRRSQISVSFSNTRSLSMWRSARGGTTRPTVPARVLGHRVDAWSEDEATAPSRVQHFFQAFLRLLRKAIEIVAMTPPTAAAYAGFTIPDVVQLLGRPAGDTHDIAPSLQAEFDEFEVIGAV